MITPLACATFLVSSLAELKGHSGRVNSAYFSPDGQTIITASDDNKARIWQVEDLNKLLMRGCRWLNDYLVVHPKQLEKLEVRQNKYNTIATPPFIVKEGDKQAREGNIDGAITSLHQALKWDANLKLELETKAKQIESASKLIDKGEDLVFKGDIEGAIATFQSAFKLDHNLNIE